MPKEKPLQGHGPIRGNDTLIMAEKSDGANIPATVITRLEQEIQGVEFGGVSLIITIRDGHPTFRIEKTVSIMTGV
jgi:hypothetical protein